MSTGPGGGSGTGPGGGGGTGPGRLAILAPALLAEADRVAQLGDIDDVLAIALDVLADIPAETRLEVAGVEILRFRLRLARRGVADLVAINSPARQDHEKAAAVGALATPGGSGRPLGLSPSEGRTSGLVGVAPAAHGMSAGGPPTPGADADFRLPRDIRADLREVDSRA